MTHGIISPGMRCRKLLGSPSASIDGTWRSTSTQTKVSWCCYPPRCSVTTSSQPTPASLWVAPSFSSCHGLDWQGPKPSSCRSRSASASKVSLIMRDSRPSSGSCCLRTHYSTASTSTIATTRKLSVAMSRCGPETRTTLSRKPPYGWRRSKDGLQNLGISSTWAPVPLAVLVLARCTFLATTF
jgi:hypothetical protein